MRPGFNIISNWGSVTLLLAALFLPIYGPLMVDAEGALFPVTTRISIDEATVADDHIDIRFSYEKLRACEIVGVEARHNHKRVDFARVVSSGKPSTNRPGEQTSKAWRLARPSLEGVSIYWIHRCHPLWLTVTKVFGD